MILIGNLFTPVEKVLSLITSCSMGPRLYHFAVYIHNFVRLFRKLLFYVEYYVTFTLVINSFLYLIRYVSMLVFLNESYRLMREINFQCFVYEKSVNSSVNASVSFIETLWNKFSDSMEVFERKNV